MISNLIIISLKYPHIPDTNDLIIPRHSPPGKGVIISTLKINIISAPDLYVSFLLRSFILCFLVLL